MGAPWKMPTLTQAEELKNGTTSEWTALNGKAGIKLTSKSDTSKYIFLPAGGYWLDNSSTSPSNVGTWHRYWLTNWSSFDNSYIMYGERYNPLVTGTQRRFWGLSVRAIKLICLFHMK